jgi:hypothetical protein
MIIQAGAPQSRVRPPISFAAMLFLALALVIAITTGTLTDLSMRTHPAQVGVGSIRGDGLAGGTEVSLAKAAEMTNLPMLLPSVPLLASPASITKVWARSEHPDVLVDYGSGVSAELRSWDLATTPVEHWHGLMSVDGLPGSIISDIGVDMYVMPPGGQGGGGSVSFVENGTWVSIYGDGTLSADQLQLLAESAASQTG